MKLELIQKYFINLLITVFLFSVMTEDAIALEITFVTHKTQGSTFRDKSGELRGKKNGGRRAFHVELVREMMILMQHPCNIKAIPFARGLMMLKEEKNFAIFNVARRPDREQIAKWVGPIIKDSSYFYQMQTDSNEINNLGDAKKVRRICLKRGSSVQKFLENKGFTNLSLNTNNGACFQMMKMGRIQLGTSSGYGLMNTLNSAKMSMDEVRKTSVKLLDNEGYIAFSKDVSDKIIRQWQQALDTIKSSGRYEQLVKEYLNSKQ